MTLLEMSVSAALFILAATVIRARAIHKLPRKSFLLLWGIALFLLFVPVRFPSPASLFSLFSAGTQGTPAGIDLPALTGRTEAGGFAGFAPAGIAAGSTVPAPAPTPGFWQVFSPWVLAWLVGCVLCTGFFLLTHLRCRRRYQISLPCENAFVNTWLAGHKLRRRVQVRVSHQVDAPLTYGIMRPVILLPNGLDWNNDRQLGYILTHEWVHIKRFDVAFKALLVAAVCLHWFNPLVWVLFVLAGRDIELACDEAVVRRAGHAGKKDYALALVSLEGRKSRFAPLCTSFSKNGVEERIRGIMKWKKQSVLSVALAVVLVAGVATVFATSATGCSEAPVLPDSSAPVSSGAAGADIPSRYGAGSEVGNHSGYSAEDYAALMALKTDGYRDESLADFNARIAPHAALYSGYNIQDENIDFLLTLGYSSAEQVYAENGEDPMEMVGTAVNINVGTDDYYGAEMDYEVVWSIPDPTAITVGRRDDVLNGCHVAIQKVFGQVVADEQDGAKLRQRVQQCCDELAEIYSAEDIRVAIAVQNVNKAAEDMSFVWREYPLLMELYLEDYAGMTISAYRNAVHQKMSANEEAYLLEIDRATRDNRFARTRYTNGDASYVMNTLAPLTAERWQSGRYSGFFTEAAGTAEYQFTLTILDADTLTVAQHTAVWQGMATAIGEAFRDAPAALWADEDGMKSLLQAAANAALEAVNPAVKVELGYIGYLPDDSAQA